MNNFFYVRNFRSTFLIFLFLSGFSYTSYSQYTIPSYNVNVAKNASFVETSHMLKAPAERRVLIIHVFCGTLGGSCQATIWVCSLDGRTILGPYYTIILPKFQTTG
jgi:hypothetical protein